MYDSFNYQARKEFGQRVKMFRRAKGLTQLQLANLLGFNHPSQVCEMEKGRRRIPPELVPKLTQLLDCEIVDLVEYQHTAEHPI